MIIIVINKLNRFTLQMMKIITNYIKILRNNKRKISMNKKINKLKMNKKNQINQPWKDLIPKYKNNLMHLKRKVNLTKYLNLIKKKQENNIVRMIIIKKVQNKD